MKWKYYEPKFEFSDEIFSAWWGHVYFAYDYVHNVQPKTIVELGTHNGVSFFSFCQAVKDSGLDASLYAVDAWEGDKHAGFYDESIYQGVIDVQKRYYSNLDIQLYKMYFDKAVNKFDDHSIDLLHIDGLHTYDAVKNDFEAWLPKMKKTGVIFFHDIHERKLDFGVYKLWNELKEEYSSLEFYHWHGLGILFMKDNQSTSLIEDQDTFKGHYANRADQYIFKLINNEKQNIKKQNKQIQTKNQSIQQKNEQLAQKNKQIHIMEDSKFWKLRNKYMNVKNNIIQFGK